MRKLVFIGCLLLAAGCFHSKQAEVSAPKQTQSIYLMHATIHAGDGKVLKDATIAFENGTIILLEERPSFKTDETMGRVIDCTGKYIYPCNIAAPAKGGVDTIGTLEKGKAASLIVSDGDVLDMKTSNIIYAFIDGRQINLSNKQKELNEKFKKKYGLN